MGIDLLRVRLHALLQAGDVPVEVEGTVMVSPRTRSSDALSAPDNLQELFDATITRFLPTGPQQEQAPEITVNRDRMLLVTLEEGERTVEPGMRVELDAHEVRLLCAGFEVSGTLHTVRGASPLSLVTTGGQRFVGVTDAEVKSTSGKALPSFEGKLQFCLVNRSSVQAVIAGPAAAAMPAAEGAEPAPA